MVDVPIDVGILLALLHKLCSDACEVLACAPYVDSTPASAALKNGTAGPGCCGFEA